MKTQQFTPMRSSVIQQMTLYAVVGKLWPSLLHRFAWDQT